MAVGEYAIDHRGAEIGLHIGGPIVVIWKPGHPQIFTPVRISGLRTVRCDENWNETGENQARLIVPIGNLDERRAVCPFGIKIVITMTDKSSDISNSVIDLGRISAEEVSINTGARIVAITEDKLKLALLERQAMLLGRDAWVAPLGIVVAILLAILTTDFRRFLLAAAVWEATFYIALLLSVVWLAWALLKRPTARSIDDFIRQLKKTEQ